MKKLFQFIFYLLLMCFVIIVISLIPLLGQKKDVFYIFTKIVESVVEALPITSALSLFWALVFKSKKDIELSPSKAAILFSVFVYIFLVIILAGFLQEILLPALDNKTISLPKITLKKQSKEVMNVNPVFTQRDEVLLKKLPYKENIVFMMGDVFVFIRRMYKGDIYYIEDARLVGYSKKGGVDFIINLKYGKIVSGNIYPSSVSFIDYTGKGSKIFSISPSKRIPFTYEPAAIYAFASDEEIKRVSLIDVFRYSDYLFSSKVNFTRLGNIIYNQIVYYIIVFFLLLVSSIAGGKYAMTRPLYRDYFEFFCAIVVSFVGVVILYDIFVSFAKVIYEFLV